MRVKRGEKKRKPDARIPEPIPIPDSGLSFSFNYIDLQGETEDFSTARCKAGYLDTLLERLRDISGWTCKDLKISRSQALRSHRIDWEQTAYENFPVPEPLKELEPWQFQLTANEHGRIHGFFIGETFYIVWLDPEHRLYR
jgi:hypothetical protein